MTEDLEAILEKVAQEAVDAYLQAESDRKREERRLWKAANPEAVARYKAKHAAYNSVYQRIRAEEDPEFRARRSRAATESVRRRVLEDDEYRARRLAEVRAWRAANPEAARAIEKRKYEKLMADPERRAREQERWRENNRRRAQAKRAGKGVDA